MDVLVDALPYVDREIEQLPGLKDAVAKEIQREMKTTPQVTQDDERLPPKAEIFSQSESLAHLLQGYPSQTLAAQKAIDPSKWQVPTLQPSTGVPDAEWTEAERKTRTALAHMDLRNVNAQLQGTYGPNAWLIRNYQLDGEAKEIEAEVEEWREKVTEVNRSRRVFQEATGKHLQALETRWQDLVTGTVQLEMANVALQGEVDALAQRAEALEKELEERV
ncbi:hypothetical protein QFC20_004766 [Naganishia adeliensis]|uniref:Uncharacterized protein n=1 Tax=Naganishia adeliensis TaxID=92952 RepID=A0ACC2VWZ1_9TREE|nr:hypothetical protein QFC20_004766 [Naganishia adeliensis]